MLRTALLALSATASAALGPGTVPAPKYGAEANGGWFARERHIAPAAGKKPHVAFILMDDYGWASRGR